MSRDASEREGPTDPVAATVRGMSTPRVTIVGGGSTHWTPRLLVDFANTEALHDTDVTLMDVDPDSLPLMAEVAEHIAKVRGIGLSVRHHHRPR